MPKETEELQQLTVVVLRDLAKKRLGPGTSKLRTKAQLIAALSRGSVERPPAAAAPARGSPAPGSKGSLASKGSKAKKLKKLAPALPKPPARSHVKKPAATETTRAAMGSAAAPDLPDAPSPEPLLALPLDAQTLLVRWRPVPARGRGERWELEVSSDGQPVRTIAVAPQSRQAYVRALVPGPVYRAKLIARDANGRSRVIGAPSRPVVFFPQPEAFPPTERFVRYSWSEPASSAMGPDQPAPGDPFPGGGALATLGMGAISQPGLATSPTGSLMSSVADSTAGLPLGWLVSSRLPTSFAN